MHHPRHPAVRHRRGRQVVLGLEVLDLRPEPLHRGERRSDVVVGHPRRDLGLLVARFVHESRDRRRERRGVEPLPDVVPQALRSQQVLLGVEPAQPLTPFGDHGAVLVEVPQRLERVADAVEDAGHGVGAALDLALQPHRLALEAPPAFGPAGVGLAVRALVAGVGAQLLTQHPHVFGLGVATTT